MYIHTIYGPEKPVGFHLFTSSHPRLALAQKDAAAKAPAPPKPKQPQPPLCIFSQEK